MNDDKGKNLKKKFNTSESSLSRKAFLQKSLTTAGLLAINKNKLFKLSDHLFPVSTSSVIKKRVKKLIRQMTLKEKVSQLQTNAPAIPRLHIPKYGWWSECLHGVARAGLATSFPQAIGLSASWSLDLMHKVATAISDEARAKHHAFAKAGVRERYTGLTFFAPNINIVRDPRWGRGQETYGEDPYLTGHMAKWYIKGLQGDNPEYHKLIATSKHFAAYNGPEPLRHKINENISDFDLYDTYLPAFETTIKEARVGSVMCAYNSLNGLPCCGNNKILESILRNDWKFTGYIVSDCGAISDFYRPGAHDVVKTAAKAAALGLTSGTDLNCGDTFNHLQEAEIKNLVNEREVDWALERLFTARFHLGMFDSPEKVPYSQIPYSVVNSKKNQKLALEMARNSIVLLKNEPTSAGEKSPVLPLLKNTQSIAVIGPNADDAETMLGNYHGTPAFVITPLKGIRQKVSSDTKVNYARGCEMAEGMNRLFPIPAKILTPSKGNGMGLYGEYFGNIKFSGLPDIKRVDPNIDFTWLDKTPVNGQMAAKFAVRWSGKITAPKTGEYIFGLNANGYFKMTFENEVKISTMGHHEKQFTANLEAGKSYDIEVEYINSGPDPRIHLVWKVPGHNLLDEAVEAAKKSDSVILCLGLNSQMEGEEMPVHIDGFDGGDRTKLDLSATQKNLMKEILKLGKPTVLVLLSGSALAIPWAKNNIPAIVQAWYGGQAGGTALADVLFGDYNPAGRLPLTFYQSVDDLPPFTDYRMENRTYRYFKGEPLFPFGFGLSYTTFQYANLKLTLDQVKRMGVEISVDVTNTGKLQGDEVIQVYVDNLDYKGKKPIRSLKGFKRISLKPGEKKKVFFHLKPDDLALIDEKGQKFIPSGRIKISVGGKQPGFTGTLDAKTTGVVDKIFTI